MRLRPLAPPLLLLGLLLAGACSSHRSRVLIHGYGDLHVTTQDLEYHIDMDKHAASIAVFRDGALGGPELLDASERRRIGLEDAAILAHPKLPGWQRQLAQLRALADDPGAEAGSFADAAVGFPFTVPTSEAALRFTDGQPGRAAALLDRADDLSLRGSDQRTIAERALGAEGVDDARIAAWARTRALGEETGALKTLALAPAAGERTALAVVARLDDFFGDDRAKLYRVAGQKLVARAEHAALLGRALDELYGSDRAQAALALLEREDAAPAYAVTVLSMIDDFYGSDREAVFRRAAPTALAQGQVPLVSHALVEEFYGDDRTELAVWLLGRPDAGPALVGAVAREMGEFHGDDRMRALDAMLASKGFAGEAQRDVVRAAAREFSGEDRKAALDRVAAAELEAPARTLLEIARTR